MTEATNEIPGFQTSMLKLALLGEVRTALIEGQDDVAVDIMRALFDILPTEQLNGPGCVYVVRAEGLDRYKIGFSTTDPKYRIAALQTGSAVPLRLVALIEGCSLDDELALHHRFSTSRLAGEWFRATQDVLAFVHTHRLVQP